MAEDIEKARHALSHLARDLAEAFDPDLYGFPWYASIEDPVVRAVRSNQAIGLVDAAAAHIEALQEAISQVRELVGPNGRTMPTPDELAELRIIERIYVEITDALRAAGSLLDVLGGLVVLFLGLRLSPASADSRYLLRCEPEPRSLSAKQAEATGRLREVVANAIDDGPDGWLEWAVESRNAQVHRGRELAIWLPVPAHVDRARIAVVTEMGPERVVRRFPHLRRQPDLTDAESVLAGTSLEDVYLHEPAQDTLDGLARRSAALAGIVAQALRDLIADMAGFSWPTEEWILKPRSDRAQTADAFRGFDPTHPPADLEALVLNPRDAKRLLPMEELRLERG